MMGHIKVTIANHGGLHTLLNNKATFNYTSLLADGLVVVVIDLGCEKLYGVLLLGLARPLLLGVLVATLVPGGLLLLSLEDLSSPLTV